MLFFDLYLVVVALALTASAVVCFAKAFAFFQQRTWENAYCAGWQASLVANQQALYDGGYRAGLAASEKQLADASLEAWANGYADGAAEAICPPNDAIKEARERGYADGFDTGYAQGNQAGYAEGRASTGKVIEMDPDDIAHYEAELLADAAARQPGYCACGEPTLPGSEVCIDCGYQAYQDALFSAAFDEKPVEETGYWEERHLSNLDVPSC